MQIEFRDSKCFAGIGSWRFLAFCLVTMGLLPAQLGRSQSAVSPRFQSSGGTINIILARGQDLVAVTDSMLSSTSGQHVPGGVKLFKIDDRTLCTMAGLYSQDGPNNSIGLNVFIPEIISHLQAKNTFDAQTPFEIKARTVFWLFEHSLTSNLQALVTANPNISPTALVQALQQMEPLELTLAGYDLDSSLKVAEITLHAQKTNSGFAFVAVDRPRRPSEPLPLCEVATPTRRISTTEHEGPFFITTIGSTLFCTIAGLPEVAEEILDKPYNHQMLGTPNNLLLSESVRKYAMARQDNKNLSLDEMRLLAIELEKQTAEDERRNGHLRVGGHPQIAILSEGKIIEEHIDDAQYDKATGKALGGLHVNSFTATCADLHSIPYYDESGGSHSQIQLIVTNCTQELDGLLIHDSRFTRSNLIYSGGELAFDANNFVEDSTLRLTKGVDTKRKDVRRLVCGFPWKAVYQDSEPLKLQCDSVPSR